jgi:hypothetical protein
MDEKTKKEIGYGAVEEGEYRDMGKLETFVLMLSLCVRRLS